jgi:hypothetical protein
MENVDKFNGPLTILWHVFWLLGTFFPVFGMFLPRKIWQP